MLEHRHTKKTGDFQLSTFVCCCLTADKRYGRAGNDDAGQMKVETAYKAKASSAI